MNEIKLKSAVEELSDVYCDCFGVRHCISLLIDQCGFTKEDLLELRFDEDDIDAVLEDAASALEEEAFEEF